MNGKKTKETKYKTNEKKRNKIKVNNGKPSETTQNKWKRKKRK